MKREPEKLRVKWESAEITETESREGMKKIEDREEERDGKLIEQSEEEKIQRESPSSDFCSTEKIEIELFSPHITFFLIPEYFLKNGRFPSK
jgi:hypothetical protein